MRQDHGQDLGEYEARSWPRSTGDMRQDHGQDLRGYEARSWPRSRGI